MMKNVTERQIELTKILSGLSGKYYNQSTSRLQDISFDKLYDELISLEEESGIILADSPTQYVGAKASNGLKDHKHEFPALSLGKIKYKNKEEMIDWLGSQTGLITPKCDGNTIILTYDNGQLAEEGGGCTRGDGIIGSIITHNVLNFVGIPKEIPYKGHLVVRGEAVMTFDEFNRLNELADGRYENARNLATATTQMLNPEEAKEREVQFQGFKLICPAAENVKIDGFDMSLESQRFEWIKSLGFNVVHYEKVTKENVLDVIENWQQSVKELAFPTDGLVFSYEDAVYADSLGSTNKHPRGSIALKWTDETKKTKVVDVEFSIGKTGVLTPVVIFEPVRLGIGSTVERASLHNISMMENIPSASDPFITKPLMIGSTIDVYLANMIIPQVASIENMDESNIPVKIPAVCPICGQPLTMEYSGDANDIKTLHCNNESCGARQIGRLMSSFSKSGLNVKGLGESQIADLIATNLVDANDPSSFYRLQKKYGNTIPAELNAKEGWGQLKWGNLLAALEKSRQVTFPKFLYSLNITMLGHDLSKKLDKFWNSDVNGFLNFVLHENMDTEVVEKLLAIDGIGDEKINSLMTWAKDVRHDCEKMDHLGALIQELKFEAPAEKKEQSLADMTFVITGSVNEYKNRDEFKASVEARGGKVSGSVSKNTNYLVNNDVNSTTGKNAKAKELSVPVLSEMDFIEKFGK